MAAPAAESVQVHAVDAGKLRRIAMNHHRLRLKVGEHEFEAEGAPDFVEHQLRAFELLIRPGSAPAIPAAVPAPPPLVPTDQLVARVARVNRTVVYLTAKPPSVPAAALLIVLGNKILRRRDAVSGADVKRGLEASGVKLPRVDRVLAQVAAGGDLFVTGRKRAKRYGLTEAGIGKSRSIAAALAGV